MRGHPTPRKGSDKQSWRSRQKPGSIMKPSTFRHIAQTAKGKGGKPLSAARRKLVAGKAYQRSLSAKYKAR